MSYVVERFQPIPMAANSSVTLSGQQIGGFLAKTSGTLTLTGPTRGPGTSPEVLIDAVPVTLGTWLPLPFLLTQHGSGAVVTLAGGASGTLGT